MLLNGGEEKNGKHHRQRRHTGGTFPRPALEAKLLLTLMCLRRQRRPSLPSVSLSPRAAGSCHANESRGAMFVKGGDSSCSPRQRRKSVSERLRVSGLLHWGSQNIQSFIEGQMKLQP